MINMKEIFAHDRIGNIDCELAPLTKSERSKYLLNDFDLLFARQSLSYEGAGKCSLVLPSDKDRTWESHLIRVRLNPKLASPSFYYYYFRSPQGRRNIESIIQQVAAAGIRGSDLARLSIPNPPLAEQLAVAEVLSALDDKITVNERLAATAENLAVSLISDRVPSISLSEIVSHRKASIGPTEFGAAKMAHFSLPAFDDARLPDLCRPDEIRSTKFQVQVPSVLISKLNPRFPRVWDILKMPSEPAVASTEFLVLEPVESSTSVLWAILGQPKFGRDLEAKVAGTSSSHQRVKPMDLLATQVIDPRKLNAGIRDAISKLSESAIRSRTENQNLAETRDALNQHFIAGRFRVDSTDVTCIGA